MADRPFHPYPSGSAYDVLLESGVKGSIDTVKEPEELEEMYEKGSNAWPHGNPDKKKYIGDMGKTDAVDMLFDRPGEVDPELRARYVNEFVPANGYSLPLDERGKPVGLIPYEDVDEEELKAEFSKWLDGQDLEEKNGNAEVDGVGPDSDGNYTLDFSKLSNVSGGRWWANKKTAEVRTPSMLSRQPASRTDRQPFVDEGNPISDHYLELRRVWDDPNAGVGYIIASRPEDDRIVFVSDKIAEPPRPLKAMSEDFTQKYSYQLGRRKEQAKRPTQLSVNVDDFNYVLRKAGINLQIARPKSADDREAVMDVLKHLKIGTEVFRGQSFAVEHRQRPKQEKKEKKSEGCGLKINEDELEKSSPAVVREAVRFVRIAKSGKVFEWAFGIQRGLVDSVGISESSGTPNEVKSASLTLEDFCRIFDGAELFQTKNSDKPNGIRFGGEGGAYIYAGTTDAIAKSILGKLTFNGKVLNRDFVVNKVRFDTSSYPRGAKKSDFYP